MPAKVKEKIREIYGALPKLNCGKCGYHTCGEYARALAKGEAQPGFCVAGGPAGTSRLREIMGSGATCSPDRDIPTAGSPPLTSNHSARPGGSSPRERRNEEMDVLKNRARLLQLELDKIGSEISRLYVRK